MVIIAILINEFDQLKLFYIGTIIHESHDNILFLKIFKFSAVKRFFLMCFCVLSFKYKHLFIDLTNIKVMKRIFKLVEKYFFIIILIVVVIAVIIPNSFNWVMEEFMGINVINVLLGVILFGMGTTLK
jgi:hypothetical protein